MTRTFGKRIRSLIWGRSRVFLFSITGVYNQWQLFVRNLASVRLKQSFDSDNLLLPQSLRFFRKSSPLLINSKQIAFFVLAIHFSKFSCCSGVGKFLHERTILLLTRSSNAQLRSLSVLFIALLLLAQVSYATGDRHKSLKYSRNCVNVFKSKASVINSEHWQQRVGSQRNWVWRGWQTRYTYIRPTHSAKKIPLVLLHGFGTSIGHWRQNLAVLGEHHTVYALDMLGFGASEKASVSYKVDLWVEQVYDFWRTFIREPVVLIGNSIGSLVCLAAAAVHPDMVQGIVMLSLPDLSIREEAMPQLLRPVVKTIENFVASPLLIKSLFRVLRRPGVVRRWAGLAYANPDAVTDELVDILVGPAQDRGSAQVFYAVLKAMTNAQFGPSVKAVLPTLKIPILLIWGQQDRMVPSAFAHRFTAYNPNLQLLKLDNAGHCPHDECPEQVNQAVLDWIDKNNS